MLKAALLVLTAGIAWRALPAQADSVADSSAAARAAAPPAAVRVAPADSGQPAMPAELVSYRRVSSAKVVVDGAPGMAYQYTRGSDRIGVLVTQYDPAQPLRTQDDTINLVRDDYTKAFSSLCDVAQKNDAYVGWYANLEDDLHVGKHTYRGYVYRYAFFRRPNLGGNCEGRPARVQGWSFYSQTYALPHWLVRIRGRLQPFESVGNGALPMFSKSLVAAMVHGSDAG